MPTSLGLGQLISIPTRVTETSSTLIVSDCRRGLSRASDCRRGLSRVSGCRRGLSRVSGYWRVKNYLLTYL